MKRSKLLSLLLTIVIAVSLAACGGGSAPAPASSGQAAPAASTPAASTPAAAQAAPAAGKPFDLKMMLILYNQAPDPKGEFWKDMQSKYNVNMTIEWVPESTYTDKLSLTLATNSIPDVTQIPNLTNSSVVKAMEAGQFYNLTPKLDFNKYKNLGKISSSAWMNSKYKGKNFVFPRSRGQYNDAVFIRGDLLEKNGMKKPETIDQLTEYFRKIKSPDMIPLPTELGDINGGLTGFIYEAFGPGNIRPVFTEDKSGIIYPTLTETYVKVLEYLRMCYSEGILAKEFTLYKTEKNQDMLLAGKGGLRFQNAWHRYRLETELKKTVPDAKLTALFGIAGNGGQTVSYDIGFYGGYALNAKLTPERLDWILDFYNKTAAPEVYNYFKYGIEGSYYKMVDGYPALTELGAKEVTNSFYGPYVLATYLYDKVQSPLAPAAYNKESEKLVKDVDVFAAKIGAAPFRIFSIIQSPAWAQFASMNQKDFDAYVADTVSGKHTIDEFRAYQKKILGNPDVQKAFKEFKASYDEYGLANWKPNN